MTEVKALLAELDRARAEFHQALENVDEALATAPGVVGEWSVRDLVVHVAAWCEHATAALDLAAAGRGGEFGYSRDQTDAMNEEILAQAKSLPPQQALIREDEAFHAFRARVAGLEGGQLDEPLGNGDTVEAVIRYDGPDHYAEHSEHLRAWFDADDDGDPDGP